MNYADTIRPTGDNVTRRSAYAYPRAFSRTIAELHAEYAAFGAMSVHLWHRHIVVAALLVTLTSLAGCSSESSEEPQCNYATSSIDIAEKSSLGLSGEEVMQRAGAEHDFVARSMDGEEVHLTLRITTEADKVTEVVSTNPSAGCDDHLKVPAHFELSSTESYIAGEWDGVVDAFVGFGPQDEWNISAEAEVPRSAFSVLPEGAKADKLTFFVSLVGDKVEGEIEDGTYEDVSSIDTKEDQPVLKLPQVVVWP